jgi:hypothetical protein
MSARFGMAEAVPFRFSFGMAEAVPFRFSLGMAEAVLFGLSSTASKLMPLPQGGGAFTLEEVAVSEPACIAILRQAGRIDFGS